MTKDSEVGTQRETTQSRRQAQEEAHQLYMQHLTIARMAIPRSEVELWK